MPANVRRDLIRRLKVKFTWLVTGGTRNGGCLSIARYFAAQIHVDCKYLCEFCIRTTLGNNTIACSKFRIGKHTEFVDEVAPFFVR